MTLYCRTNFNCYDDVPFATNIATRRKIPFASPSLESLNSETTHAASPTDCPLLGLRNCPTENAPSKTRDTTTDCGHTYGLSSGQKPQYSRVTHELPASHRIVYKRQIQLSVISRDFLGLKCGRSS